MNKFFSKTSAKKPLVLTLVYVRLNLFKLREKSWLDTADTLLWIWQFRQSQLSTLVTQSCLALHLSFHQCNILL